MTLPTPAPDATLLDTEGAAVQLSVYWKRQPVVLVFLRHFGCTFCREQVAMLRRDYTQFQGAGAEIVCVAQGNPKTGKAFRLFFDLPFPLLLTGDDLSLYRAFGLNRGTWGQLFGLASLTRGIAATLRGHLLGRLVGDGRQLAGAFVIDTAGTIQYAHRHKTASDNPSTRELLDAVRRLPAMTA